MGRQVTGALAALVGGCLAAAGCSAARNDSARVTAATCPEAMARSSAPAGPTIVGSLVRPGPAVVAVCQYSPGLAK